MYKKEDLENTYIKIGKVIGKWGKSLEIKIISYLDTPEELASVSKIYIQSKLGYKPIELENIRVYRNGLIASIKGVEDERSLKLYFGKEIFTQRKDLPKIRKKNTYYVFDIIGCEVYDTKNRFMGTVTNVIDIGPNWVLEVGKKKLIPFIKKFIKEIDINNRKIFIQKEEDLLI